MTRAHVKSRKWKRLEQFSRTFGEVYLRRWTQDIGEWMGVSTVESGRQAFERGEFRQAVWEATSIKDPP